MNILTADSVFKTRRISPALTSAKARRSANKAGKNISGEFELLLSKAKPVLAYYSEATGIPAMILDQAGNNESGRQEELHHDAFLKSQRLGKAIIYNCPLGNTYLTSPLYSKNRYTGALVAGKIPSDGEKSPEKIRAMAGLLELCAKEITGKDEAPCSMIRSMIRKERYYNEAPKAQKIKELVSTPEQTVSENYENSEYLMEKERLLLAALRRGDMNTGRKILKEYLNFLASSVSNNIEITRFRAIELIVLLSRAAATEGRNRNELLENNNRYIKRIQESGNLDEVMGNMNIIAERMSADVFSFQGVRHASVLRRAERYIWDNYTRKISLEEIAAYSGLSAPYFSTIFKEEMGENLSSYLNRLRVEKASNLLMATGKNLNEISEICGFEDQSWFSKIFKKYNGISPGRFRERGNNTAEPVSNGGEL